MRTAWVLASLTILLGSYSAASTEPALPVAERPAPRIGRFQLDRFPQQGALARGIVPPGTVRLVIDGHDIRFAADRRFIVGFGRDHAGSTTITAFLADGGNVNERLAVSRTAWIIESLSSLPYHAQPNSEFRARRPMELEQIATARRVVTNAEGWRQDFIWPVSGRITGHFGAQRIYAGEPGAPHAGVDLAGRAGTPVLAPADGVVILAASRPFTLEGKLLMIDHGMGLNSAFLHLSRIDVKVGDTIRRGQPLGAVGMTGRATGPHLHWGMKWQDERIDPAMLPPRKP